MKLTKDDIGKYYMVVDVYDGLTNILCKFIRYRNSIDYYPYEMIMLNGKYKDRHEVFAIIEVIKEIDEITALTIVM